MTDRPIANVDAAAAWDGEEGANWAANADHYDAAAVAWNKHLLEHITPDDDVLDIGCGNGGSARDAARVARTVLGLDLSSEMLKSARNRARDEGLTNIRFEQGDAQVHPFEPESFDVAISRFGAMFFSDPVAAFTNIARALRPDGRLAVLGWQGLEQNEWIAAVRDALALGRDLPVPPLGAPGPFGLADPDLDRRILTDAGFDDVAVEDLAEPLCFGTDADDAYGFLSDIGPVRGMLADLDEDAKAKGLTQLRELIELHATPDGVMFAGRAWLITGRKP